MDTFQIVDGVLDSRLARIKVWTSSVKPRSYSSPAPLLCNASLCAGHTARPRNKDMSKFGAEKGLLQGHARSWVAQAPKNPNSSRGVSKAIFKGWWLQTSRCWNPSCSFPHRSHHHLPVNRQWNKCHSLFCHFLSLRDWLLKIESWECAILYFLCYKLLFYKRCKASMTKLEKGSRSNMESGLLFAVT